MVSKLVLFISGPGMVVSRSSRHLPEMGEEIKMENFKSILSIPRPKTIKDETVPEIEKTQSEYYDEKGQSEYYVEMTQSEKQE